MYGVVAVDAHVGERIVAPDLRLPSQSVANYHWRNDGVAADGLVTGGPTGGRGPPTVVEFLVINFAVWCY